MMRSGVLMGLLVLFAFSPVFAAQTPQAGSVTEKKAAAVTSPAPLFSRKASAPEVSSIPILANISKEGGKFYYLGERSGLNGWIVIVNGKTQIVYVTSDGETAIIGPMFSGDGKNISAAQIRLLSETEKDIADLVNGKVALPEPGAIDKPEDKTAGESAVQKEHGEVSKQSPGERLLQDLQSAAGVVMGRDDASQVNVIMSLDCPSCRATWKELKPAVIDGLVQVKMIPVVNAFSDEEKAAAQMLKGNGSFEAWDRYANGDKDALSGETETAYLEAVRGNFSLVERWNIKATPYIVYRAKDGQVKIIQGRPEKISVLLNDLPK